MRKTVNSPRSRRCPTQQRAQETVNAILGAVIRLLKRRGASGITTNTIADAAGVSIGSVYQYFPDKQAIFVLLHERHIEQIDRVLHDKLVQSADEPLETLISRLMDGMIEVHAADPELSALLDSEVPHHSGSGREFSSRLHGPLRRALAPHANSLGGVERLSLRAFLLANMLDTFGHAVVLRRPRDLSQRNAKIQACKAILAALKS